MKMYIGLFMALILFLLSHTVIAGPEMVFVKGGCFQMGDTFDEGQGDEKPVHEVCVDDFFIGRYEVTQPEWESIMGTNPSWFKYPIGNVHFPVESVSWNDIQEFIRKLNQKTGKNYRLPTEAEWEYAARSGGKDELWAGHSDVSELATDLVNPTAKQLHEYAWYGENACSGDIDRDDENAFARVHPVGTRKPNGLGLYDMSGNVDEWVWDRYDAKYYERSPKNNPKGPLSGKYGVIRGGGWGSNTRLLRTMSRFKLKPDLRDDAIGFRLALSPR